MKCKEEKKELGNIFECKVKIWRDNKKFSFFVFPALKMILHYKQEGSFNCDFFNWGNVIFFEDSWGDFLFCSSDKWESSF